MSLLEKGLYALLHEDAGIAALVGENIYFTVAPKLAGFPLIIISTVAGHREVTLDSTAEQRERRMQFLCVSSKDQTEAREIADAVMSVVVDYKGTLDSGTVVSSAAYNLDLDVPYEVGAKGFAYGTAIDVTFFVTEAQSS